VNWVADADETVEVAPRASAAATNLSEGRTSPASTRDHDDDDPSSVHLPPVAQRSDSAPSVPRDASSDADAAIRWSHSDIRDL